MFIFIFQMPERNQDTNYNRTKKDEIPVNAAEHVNDLHGSGTENRAGIKAKKK